MIKACIFDHDGVIVDTESFHKVAWRQVLRESGINATDDEISARVRGVTRWKIIREFFGDIDHQKTIEIAARKDEIYFALLEDKLKLIDGLTEALEYLKKLGIRIALASSAVKHTINFTFSLFDIEKYFDAVLTAEDVTRGKPDPELFLEAAKAVGVDPSGCLVFEDSFAGVTAANAAGMKVVLVESSHKRDEFAPGTVNKSIVNFRDIENTLSGLLGSPASTAAF